MATICSDQYCDNSTLANFKGWAGAISNALSTFGWVRTSDAGQTDLDTIVSVPAANTTVYEVWKATDANANVLPIYLKLMYGTGITAGSQDLYVCVGTGSDGSGNLINQSNLWRLGAGASAGATKLYSCVFSGSKGRFAMLLFRGYSGGSFFSVERDLDSSGKEQANYFTVLTVPGCAGLAPSILQTRYVTNSGNTYSGLTPTQKGTAIIIASQWTQATGPQKTAVNDSTGNIFTRVPGTLIHGTYYGTTDIWACFNHKGGITSLYTSDNYSPMQMVLFEVANLSGNVETLTSMSLGSGQTTSPSVTTTAPYAFVLSPGYGPTNSTWTGLFYSSCMCAWLLTTGPGTYSNSFSNYNNGVLSVISFSCASYSANQQTIWSGGNLPLEQGWATVQTGSGSSIFNSSVLAAPIWPLVGTLGNPMLGAVSLKASDFLYDGQTFSISMYGSPHTYMVIDSLANEASIGASNSNVFAMRFE
jgi:hypothetical protein